MKRKKWISSLSPVPQAVNMTIPSRNALGTKLPSKKSNKKKTRLRAELVITENAVDSYK